MTQTEEKEMRMKDVVKRWMPIVAVLACMGALGAVAAVASNARTHAVVIKTKGGVA